MQNELYHYRAKVISVYDGDTLTAAIDLGFKVQFTEKVRLFGINAPEMRGSERPAGILSRDRLRELVLGKEILLKTIRDKKGKYGRYLGVIFMEQEGKYVNINELLVHEGLAEKHDY
ncbi:MAG: thermonuclease family protein [Flavobacteriales bacterium]